MNRFRWWHAATIFVAGNLPNTIAAGLTGDKEFYNSLARPRVAPPDWLFAPVWLGLNVTSLIALHRVANGARGNGARSAFLASEAAGWGLFATFGPLYFGLKSPKLGAANTLAGLAAAVVSVATAWKVDRKAAALIAPRLMWLALAGYVSAWTATHNRDPLLDGST